MVHIYFSTWSLLQSTHFCQRSSSFVMASRWSCARSVDLTSASHSDLDIIGRRKMFSMEVFLKFGEEMKICREEKMIFCGGTPLTVSSSQDPHGAPKCHLQSSVVISPPVSHPNSHLQHWQHLTVLCHLDQRRMETSGVRITKLRTQWWEELMCGLSFVSFKYLYLFCKKKIGGITFQHALVVPLIFVKWLLTNCFSY